MTAETQSLQATDDNPLLADLIYWSDEDGDLLTFGFTDLNSDAGSGSLVLNGVIQTAGQEIVVREEQLLNGELLWMQGEPDQVDEVAVRASDPYGPSPTVTLHLPGEAGAAQGVALLLAGREAPSGSHTIGKA